MIYSRFAITGAVGGMQDATRYKGLKLLVQAQHGATMLTIVDTHDR
jgi:hypothetical protein